MQNLPENCTGGVKYEVISDFKLSHVSLAKENKYAKRSMRTRVTLAEDTGLPTKNQPGVWLQQETTANRVEEGRNFLMLSDSASKLEKGATQMRFTWKIKKNIKQKLPGLNLQQDKQLATQISQEDYMQNICLRANFFTVR